MITTGFWSKILTSPADNYFPFEKSAMGQLWALAEKKFLALATKYHGPKLLVMNCLLSDPASHKTGCALKHYIIKWKWYICDWALVGPEGTDYMKK